MNNSEYITASQNYAKNAKSTYEQSLSYLLSGLDEAKAKDQEAANIRYQNLINQIRQQIPGIQQQFEQNAKAAYINKQQNLQQIDADLNRLGVNTQGFGVTQRLLNEVAYGQNYGNLVLDYNNAMRDIANQETNALGDLNADLANLDAAYAKDRLDTQKYIGEQGLNVYNKEYNNYYNDLQYQDELKQQAYENEMAERKLAEQLKQQAWENAFKEKQRQDQLAQQEWERQMAQKEYDLKVKQVNASIASANATARLAKAQEETNAKSNTIVNTNYCLEFGRGAKADAYNSFINTVAKNGGITKANLEAYLKDYQANGTYTAADAERIRNQFK